MRPENCRCLALAALGGGIATAAIVGVLSCHETNHIKIGAILVAAIIAAMMVGRETPPREP